MRRSPPNTMLTLFALVRGQVSGEPSQAVVIRLASEGRGEEPLPVKVERGAAGVAPRDRSGGEGLR